MDKGGGNRKNWGVYKGQKKGENGQGKYRIRVPEKRRGNESTKMR